jgi:hypothetical protein
MLCGANRTNFVAWNFFIANVTIPAQRKSFPLENISISMKFNKI